MPITAECRTGPRVAHRTEPRAVAKLWCDRVDDQRPRQRAPGVEQDDLLPTPTPGPPGAGDWHTLRDDAPGDHKGYRTGFPGSRGHNCARTPELRCLL